MKKRLRKGRLPRVLRTWNGAAEKSLISKPVLMVVIAVLLALAAVTKLGLSRSREHASANGDSDAARAVLKHYDNANREFLSQRRPISGALPASTADPAASDHTAMLTPLHRVDQVLDRAGNREKQTAAALKRFAKSGAMAELRSVDREDVVALADYLAVALSPTEVGSMLQQFVGLPSDRVLTQEDASSDLVEIYDALVGNHVEGVRPSVLMVTDGTDADGRIIGEAHVLPAGTERVYAVFENANALEGLDRVLAVWRNPDDDRMVFTEFEPIRQGSAYNYVWLDVESGWPEGRYQVELFHPEAQSLLLASEGFSVR